MHQKTKEPGRNCVSILKFEEMEKLIGGFSTGPKILDPHHTPDSVATLPPPNGRPILLKDKLLQKAIEEAKNRAEDALNKLLQEMMKKK